MGKRTRIYSDLPVVQVRTQFLLGVFFVLGGLSGTLFLQLITSGDGISLRNYLNDYLLLVWNDGAFGSGLSYIWEALRLYLILWVLGCVFLGTIGIPVVFFERGFFLAFGAACFFKIYGLRGWLPSFVLFGLPALLWAPMLFLMGTSGFLRAQNLVRSSTGRDSSDAFFSRRVLVCLCFVFVWVLLECFVVPVLLSAVVPFVLIGTN